MPLITEASQSGKRRAPPWLLILAVVILPFLVAFTWSWFQPVWLIRSWQGVAFGRTTEAFWSKSTTSWPNYGWWSIKLPGGQKAGWYVMGWVWIPNSR